MIIDAIENAFARAKKQGWDKTYWLFDLHDTLIVSHYNSESVQEFFPYALESLQLLSKQADICLILFTSSHPQKVAQYLEKFRSLGVNFSYVNENPEAPNSQYANFDRKFYFNVMFDDKAGFHPLKDWKLVYEFLQHRYANQPD